MPPLILNGTTGISGVDGSAGTPSYQGTDTNTGIFYPAADVLAFSTNGTEDARFDSAGNFGIGTTSPSAKLNTSAASGGGSVIHYQLSETGTTGGSEMVIAANNTSFSWQAGAIGFLRESVANSYAIRFSTSSGGTNSERMRIDSSGNVGIGTSSPSYRLHTNGGDVYFQGANVFLQDDVKALVFGTGTTSYIIGSSTNNNQRFITNSTERMRIDSSGNVLVGGTSAVDSNKFQIYGAKTLSAGIPQGQLNIADTTALATGAGGAIGFSAVYTTGGAYTTMGSISGVRENATNNNYAGALIFNTRTNGGNNDERMRVTSGGDLFINTTASSGYGLAKLQIFTNLTVAGGQTIQDTATTYSTSSEYIVFTNSSGARAGSIQHTAATTVAYNTSSDARLKQDLGVATDTSVIDNTIIHNFKWIANQTNDVGVFAQEAHLVKPSAVSVGSDDLTEDGNLKQPWGVDYSKYVPDLIVYCQQLKKCIQEQQAIITDLKQRIETLEAK